MIEISLLEYKALVREQAKIDFLKKMYRELTSYDFADV